MPAAVPVGRWIPRPAISIRRCSSLNLFGTVYTINAVAPIMKEQRSGKITTVSSIAGTGPSVDGGYAHYGAAKVPSPTTCANLRKTLARSHHRELYRPGVIATGRIMATVIPSSIQSN